MLGAGAREITYAGPGLLVGSRLLSRLGLLSSSAFLQGLLSFTLICLRRSLALSEVREALQELSSGLLRAVGLVWSSTVRSRPCFHCS